MAELQASIPPYHDAVFFLDVADDDMRDNIKEPTISDH
jgi:hypothetical protein